MNGIKFFLARFVVVMGIGFFICGCQTTGGLIGPKKKVPPYGDTAASGQSDVQNGARLAPGTELAGRGLTDVSMQADWFDPATLPAMRDYIAERVTRYREKQSQWEELAEGFYQHDFSLPQPERWRECTVNLRTVIDDYLALHSSLSGSKGTGLPVQPASPYAAFQQDINYAESDCQTLFVAAAAVIPEQMKAYSRTVSDLSEQVVRYWSAQNDYDKVIESYENMIAAGDGREVAQDTRKMYASALRAKGKFKQAAEVLLEIARGEKVQHFWPIRLLAADLLFADGEYLQARREYEQLASLFLEMKQPEARVTTQLSLLAAQDGHWQELELYRRALKGWLQYDGVNTPLELVESVRHLESGFPESLYTKSARALLDKTGGLVLQNVDDALEQATRLVSERKYSQALYILAPWNDATRSGEKVGSVRELMEKIEKQQEQKPEMQSGQELEEIDAKWQKAEHMMDRQQFDQAIVIFEELLDTHYRDQAKQKIAEAVNTAAAELRKEAANLFVKARKTEAVEQKKALLLESRRLLVLVQQKYPQADIINKVKQNQAAIEEQIRALDPSRLEEY